MMPNRADHVRLRIIVNDHDHPVEDALNDSLLKFEFGQATYTEDGTAKWTEFCMTLWEDGEHRGAQAFQQLQDLRRVGTQFRMFLRTTLDKEPADGVGVWFFQGCHLSGAEIDTTPEEGDNVYAIRVRCRARRIDFVNGGEHELTGGHAVDKVSTEISGSSGEA